MTIARLALARVEAGGDDRGEQQRQRDRPDQPDPGQYDEELAAERRGPRAVEDARDRAPPGHQPSVPLPGRIANSSPSRSSSPPIWRACAIAAAASAGTGREKK